MFFHNQGLIIYSFDEMMPQVMVRYTGVELWYCSAYKPTITIQYTCGFEYSIKTRTGSHWAHGPYHAVLRCKYAPGTFLGLKYNDFKLLYLLMHKQAGPLTDESYILPHGAIAGCVSTTTLLFPRVPAGTFISVTGGCSGGCHGLCCSTTFSTFGIQ